MKGLRKNSTTNHTNSYLQYPHETKTGYQRTSSRRLCGLWLIIFSLFAVFSIPLYAQEETEEINVNEEQTEVVQVVPEAPQSRLSARERQRIEMEIKTSTLGELAVWCRTLGLPESGTREELSGRIRAYYVMPEPSARAEDNQKILTIESAQTTEYFTIGIINEDYARLRGDVSITLKDGEAIHSIKAEDILFNRTRNILTARGGVEYKKIDGSNTEIFKGENITVNIDNWASTFLDGNTSMESDGTSYLFSGRVISRTDQDVTILRNAKISSAGGDEPYWSISASRLWLLPGSDFVIANAVLKVGEIPVLYIPFFFFPTDQLIFHPVIGYRTREGGFIQTTTYILGQPKSDPTQTSSLSKIMGNSNGMQLEREGLFLRSSGKKIVNPNEISLRALLDYYVNLGTYVGLDLEVPKTGILNPLSLSLGLGFTRTITLLDNGSYSPYAPNYDGTFEKNYSNLFSVEVPFRYRMRFSSSISGKIGTLAWDFPYYSDPFVDRDFLTRAESMDWVGMLQQGAAVEETLTSDTEIQPYSWSMNGGITPSFTLLAPYISKMSLTSISTTMSFKRLTLEGTGNTSSDNPNRFFFAPDKWTIVSLSGSMAGNPLSIGGTATPKKPENAKAEEKPDPLFGIGIPISPWPDDDEKKEEAPPSADIMIPPVLRQTFSLPNAGNMRFNIDYSLTPTFTSELQFMNSLSKNNENRWKSYEDVDWAVQSILGTFGLSAHLNFSANHSSGLFSNTVSFRGSFAWRDYLHLNEEYYEGETEEDKERKKGQLRRSLFSQTNYQTSYSYTGRLQPLLFSQTFKQSSLNYSFGGTLVKSKKYTEGESPEDGPELTPEWGSWVKEETKDGVTIQGLTSHQFGANLAASIMDKTQSISLTAVLPPLDERITTGATFRFWVSETAFSTSMEKLTDRTLTAALKEKGKAEGDWLFRSIDIRETLRFSDFANLTFNMLLDPEEKFEVTSISTTLSLWELRLGFSANKVVESEFYTPDPNSPFEGNWRFVPNADPKLMPTRMSLQYGKSFNNIEVVRNWVGLTFNLNTSMTFNMQRHTDSDFQFSLSAILKITGFLELTLSATSKNKVIFRYFKNFPGMEDLTKMYPDGPQNNLLIDFFDSFNFADISKRERSGFKMDRFDISATHFLGDWTATLSVRMYPYRFNNTKEGEAPFKYKITSDISFLVQWTPISEIKTNISYDGQHDNGAGRWKVE